MYTIHKTDINSRLAFSPLSAVCSACGPRVLPVYRLKRKLPGLMYIDLTHR